MTTIEELEAEAAELENEEWQPGDNVTAVAVFHPRFEAHARIGFVADDGEHVLHLRDDVPVIEVTVYNHGDKRTTLVHQPEDTDFAAWFGVWWADRIAEEFDGFHPDDPYRSVDTVRAAHYVLGLIIADHDAGAFAPNSSIPRSFGDLHDYVDANEYLISWADSVDFEWDSSDGEDVATFNAIAGRVDALLAFDPRS